MNRKAITATILAAGLALQLVAFPALASPPPSADATVPSLDTLFSRLAASTKKKYADQIIEAVQASPALTAQLTALIASGQLTDIVVVKGASVPRTEFGAAADDTRFYIASDFLIALKNNHPYPTKPGNFLPNNTVFVLGHLAWHAQNDAAVQAQTDAEAEAMWANAPDGNVDATQTMNKMLNLGVSNEAQAFIQGWNDVVDAATHANNDVPLTLEQVPTLLINMRYANYFVMTAQQPEGSVVFTPGSGLIEQNDKNIGIMTRTLGMMPVADIKVDRNQKRGPVTGTAPLLAD